MDQKDTTKPVTPVQPQNLEGVTINTTTAESKIGLYTKVTFLGLWILVIAAIFFVNSLIKGETSSSMAVFYISVAIVAAPIFIVANNKRTTELAKNPTLIEDVFLKKYLRKNLYVSIIFTALSAFYFVFTALSKLANSDAGALDSKTILTSLVSAAGFGFIVAFCWKLHAKTLK